MLGHRGVRLGITYPEITEMQTRAIIEAACRLNKEGLKVVPEIMIPLVGHVKELRDQKAIVDRVAAETMKAKGVTIKYLVGTMIEVPRGAVTADQVAQEAQFFSFGTNDLTQMTFGFSRDDVGKFLRIYQDKKILEKDPFASIDVEGVGSLVRMGVQLGRQDEGRSEARHLRRAWRRPGVDPLLREDRPRLRERLPIPDSGGAPRRRAGGDVGQGRRLTTIYVHRNGRSEQVTSIDHAWLAADSTVVLWVDIAAPSVPESLILSETFDLHPLSVEDAMSALEFPKVERYEGYLYVVLHGLAYTKGEEGFATHDVDFFVGRNFLVTVHDGTSRSIREIRDHCPRNHDILGDGPVALFHRIVDMMIDRYLPEVDEFAEWMDEIEGRVFSTIPDREVVREILDLKRQVSALRRITIPQRDVLGRLARREFTDDQPGNELPVPGRVRPRRPHQR